MPDYVGGMPLSQLSLSSKATWSFQKANSGGVFGPTSQGPNTESLNLIGLDLSTWNQVFAASYVLFVTAPTGLTAALASGGTLTVGTTYYYKITGTGGDNNQETIGSNEVSVTPTTGNQSVKLTWLQLQAATGYKVYRGTTPGSENLLVGTITNGSTLTFTDTGFAGASASPPSSMPDNFVEFALNSFTNLAGETAAPGHVLQILLFPWGANAQCALTPAATNGMTWLWPSSSAPGNNVPVSAKGGIFQVGGAIDNAGQAITGGANALRVTNGGTGNLTVGVVAIVGK